MPSRTLPGLGLNGFWAEKEPWKDGGDENWLKLSVLAQLVVESATTALPASPADGVVYIVPAGGTDAGKVAVRDAGAWVYLTAPEGALAWAKDTQKRMQMVGGSWAEAGGGGGGIPEAPNDGKLYGRRSQTWAEVTGQGGAVNPTVPYGPHAAWRIRSTQGPSGSTSSFLVVSELRFLDVYGNEVPLGIGTATGTAGDPGREPDKAFDGNPSTSYASAPNYASNGGELLLGWTFPAAVEVAGVYIRAASSADNCPGLFEIQYQDASNNWITAWSVGPWPGWAVNTANSFLSPDRRFPAIDDAPSDGKYYARRDGAWVEIQVTP